MRNPSSEPVSPQPADLSRPVPLEGVHPTGDWAWAQARANFVLVGPRGGSAWKISETTVRGESKNHFSTLRFRAADAAGRRIRVKQNFNDWWIPTVCDISFRKPGQGLVVGDEVAFVGRDYKRHEGCCFHRWGTQVECSVEEGSLSGPDWAAFVASFDALAPEAVGLARAASFASRNYWNRWGRVEAPWDTREISRLRWEPCSTGAFERVAWATSPDQWAAMPGAPDSVGSARLDDGDEVQVVFRSAASLNCTAWLRVQREPRDPWRPLIDQGEVNRPEWSEVSIMGRRVLRASMDPTVGNWYYVWRNGPIACELHLRARPGLDATKADAVVGPLLD